MLKRIGNILATKNGTEMTDNKLINALSRHPYLRQREIDYLDMLLCMLPKNAKILEIGTFKGQTAIFMCKLRKDVTITTIDPHVGIPEHPELFSTEEEVKSNIESQGFQNRICHVPVSSHCFFTAENFDLIFIDGDHTYQGVRDDFNKFFPNLKDKGIVAFHDYGYLDGVTMFCNSLIDTKKFESYALLDSILCFTKKC